MWRFRHHCHIARHKRSGWRIVHRARPRLHEWPGLALSSPVMPINHIHLIVVMSKGMCPTRHNFRRTFSRSGTLGTRFLPGLRFLCGRGRSRVLRGMMSSPDLFGHLRALARP